VLAGEDVVVVEATATAMASPVKAEVTKSAITTMTAVMSRIARVTVLLELVACPLRSPFVPKTEKVDSMRAVAVEAAAVVVAVVDMVKERSGLGDANLTAIVEIPEGMNLRKEQVPGAEIGEPMLIPPSFWILWSHSRPRILPL
jgi:hypothetical protein